MKMKEEILKGFEDEKKLEEALVKARGQRKVELHEKYLRVEYENNERQREINGSNKNLSGLTWESDSKGDF